MPEHDNGVVRVGSYSVDKDTVERLIAWHGSEALRLPAGDGSAVRWALRQATLRALAAPPRVACQWRDVDLLGTGEGPWTLVFRGEVAEYAETVLHGDVSLSVTTGASRITAHAVLTRAGTTRPSPRDPSPRGPFPRGPLPRETEVLR
ncbi:MULTISPECIES: hypothetical protein [unclassified Streptomyces]|uniref:hypothetical protein n=1 Tax=unclassified Streptomyces TaxID=2593676 RepID=UPI002E2E4A0B|nr:hypothetical protein [Streptomyces sp. NBC_01439]